MRAPALVVVHQPRREVGRHTGVVLLRHYLEHGKTKSALARELGVSRDTIHRWIRAGDLDRDLDARPVAYGPSRPLPTKLDPFKPILEARLTAFPALSAVRLLGRLGRQVTRAATRS